jgi:anhydro-N-acetylmuramic acid kinase
MERYKAIGLMSGTSLDGVDAAACEFWLDNGKWNFLIHAAHTFPYLDEWHLRLSALHQADALTFARTNAEYGHFLGKLTRDFMHNTGFTPLLIASHGHTVFHQPSEGFTCQAGAGSAIAAETGLPVVSDFRSLDVALGGQGAPLVPIGDRLLFGEYDACLNLGGFANISMEHENQRIAFDICPVNFVLNQLANLLGMPYDRNGDQARKGNNDHGLLQNLNDLEYYTLPFPKSLGREWVETNIIPLLSGCPANTPSLLRTFTEHIAIQVNHALIGRRPQKVLVTGGGANNLFLLEQIIKSGPHRWIKPDDDITDFKEALIFAFLGILRFKGEINVLHTSTGSRMDHCGGSINII